ncbi:mucoidy inhibitor MuiA family protein [Carboxylicivirga sediminis]|uniref:Mucoidy inhibitor MuiA family protein n=1 Tax=Carboxylicivirga sediminis TaxID=2006564 RepID=A0A941F8U3_9BACT|nr:mucoidy inhibitor MuiA family protein [Carboxylicivirga sediminis]MBR8537245.1 mucoidy inhibitor MuiA family protein [Carboxylicivirga sediminis]
MRYLNLLFVWLTMTSLSASNLAEKDIITKVNEVTVFLKGAQVNRTKSIELSKGTQLLRFSGLSPYIDAKSIQVKANGALTVMSVNHQQNYLNQLKHSDEIKKLQTQKKELDAQLQLIHAYQSVTLEELEFLKANRSLGGKNEQLSLSNLQQTSTYYGKRLKELKLQEIEHSQQINLLQTELTKLEHQIRTLSGQKEHPSGEVLVKVDVKTPCKARFELSYLVSNAGWFPSYDIRSKTISEPVQLIYKANVQQDTKVDWNNVKLTFSSSDPKASGVAPELKTYYLDYNMLPPNYEMAVNEVSGRVLDDMNEPLPGVNVVVKGTSIGTVTNMDGYYSITIPNNAAYLEYSFVGFEQKTLPITGANLNVKLTLDAVGLDEVVVTGYGGDISSALQGRAAGVSVRPKKEKSIKIRGTSSLALPTRQVRNQTTVDFQIKQTYTIPTDNKNYTVDMDAYELDASYQYYCVPKIDRDAFLIARITDWEQYNLLEGEANIFFEDTYIGKTLLDVRYASDTLNLSLGRDKQVLVSRETVKNYTTRQFIGNKKQDSKAWETTIRNNKNQTINLIVLDQIPVSTLEEIEVKIDELSKGLLNKDTGEVSWEMSMAPTEQTRLQLKYTVKYPKYRNLVIE